MRFYLLLPLLLVTLAPSLNGCASANSETDRTALGTVKPCCTGLVSLPAPSPAGRINELKFDAQTPHYDFGFGIAPFARFTINPKTERRVALVSVGKGSSPLLGGDGYQHYVDLNIVFFDAEGRRLPPASVTAPFITPKPKEFADTAMLIMTRWMQIPETAAIAVAVSDPARLGVRDTARGIAPDTAIVVGQIYVPFQGGDRDFTFTHSVYGKGYLLLDYGSPQ